MKVYLRADEANGTHTKFTVFMNGANCGQLIMTEAEAVFIHDVILRTKHRIEGDELRSSGRWIKEKYEVVEPLVKAFHPAKPVKMEDCI